jgi:FixJ family two-component response regulator
LPPGLWKTTVSTVPSARKVIAVVDDEEPVRKALSRLMGTAGYEVRTFASGDAFLARTEESRPDCVVLDLHMPGVSGFDVQSTLSRTLPALPIVVITGHDIPEAGERVLAAGASAYLRKPVDGQVLLDAVASAIASPRRERSAK